MKYTLGSLFDGIAGFPYAGSQYGFEAVWASEIEPFPILVSQKHFDMRHLGDISEVNGAELEPVDVISGGSPCQDLSVAGLRKGLKHDDLGSEENTRSGLFMEQIRIVREMRNANIRNIGVSDTEDRDRSNSDIESRKTIVCSDSKGAKDESIARADKCIRPRFMVWENVPGAFSSNDKEDFRIVLEETARVKDSTVTIPRSAKWSDAGCIMGNGWSIAWRVLDAQYWGVPQRRRRIFLVADFDGECAGEILFKRGGLSRHLAESGKEGKGTAGNAADSVGETGECLTPWDVQSRRIYDDNGKWPALYSGEGGGKGYVCKEATDRHAVTAKCYGIGGYNSEGMLSANPKAGIYEAETARTLDLNGGSPACNQGGIAVVQKICFDGYQHNNWRESETVGVLTTENHHVRGDNPLVMEMTHADEVIRFHENKIHPTLQSKMRTGGNQVPMVMGDTWPEKAMPVMARDYKGPRNFMDGGLQNSVVVSGCDFRNNKENGDISGTLQAKPNGGYSYNCIHPVRVGYAVRRLTPLECLRLQAFPDDWFDDLAIENPTEQDIAFFDEVFKTHARIMGGKPKSRNQIIKWLKNPYSDSAAYKATGNSIATCVAEYIFEGIFYELSKRND